MDNIMAVTFERNETCFVYSINQSQYDLMQELLKIDVFADEAIIAFTGEVKDIG